jgi:hypothetical protein
VKLAAEVMGVTRVYDSFYVAYDSSSTVAVAPLAFQFDDPASFSADQLKQWHTLVRIDSSASASAS